MDWGIEALHRGNQNVREYDCDHSGFLVLDNLIYSYKDSKFTESYASMLFVLILTKEQIIRLPFLTGKYWH